MELSKELHKLLNQGRNASNRLALWNLSVLLNIVSRQ